MKTALCAASAAAPAWTLMAMWNLSADMVGVHLDRFLLFKAYMNPWNSAKSDILLDFM